MRGQARREEEEGWGRREGRRGRGREKIEELEGQEGKWGGKKVDRLYGGNRMMDHKWRSERR